MVSWFILGQHGLALLLVWTWVGVAGCAFLPFVRSRVGFAGAPLLGIVYWTIALYLFPFTGGLDIAAGLVGLLTMVALWRSWMRHDWTPVWKRFSWSTLILMLGSLPYTTTLLYHHVPFGMDASMHSTAATLIARTGGLPESYAPFAPDIVFPPMNLGLPTVAAMAIRWGGEPAAVMLASHHLTFTLLMLATYLLLRKWTARTSAAVLAVISVWSARATQASLEWGGFPTVLSIAIGVLAARLLLQHSQRASWRLSVATGASIAAIPLIHGVGAGSWLYCVLPWIALATLGQARVKLVTLGGLAGTGLVTVLLLLMYRSAGTIPLQARDLEWTHAWQQASAPLKDGWWTWPSAVDFVRKDSGSFIVLTGLLASGVLALRRRWLSVVLLGAAWLTLVTVVANSRWWILPASFLLYPERALYWAAPFSAVALALAWQALPNSLRGAKPLAVALAISLLLLSGNYHNQFYQRIVRGDFVNQDGWEALLWARQNLHSEHDFVKTPYNSTGSYLPAFAAIGCTGSHHHHFIERQVVQAYQRRVVTHLFLDQSLTPSFKAPEGKIVFQNRAIRIVELPSQPAAE